MIIDRNFMQVEGHTDQVAKLDPLGAKFEAFGWRALEVNGNAMGELTAALDAARETKGKPTVIVANTLAGCGVPFVEGQLSHMARVTPEDAVRALAALEDASA
jgi:transketolase